MKGLKSILLLMMLSIAGTVCAQSAHQVTLNWQMGVDNGDATVGYDVFRMLAGGQFQQVNVSIVSLTTFKDTSVSGGKTYQYFVTAVDAAGVQSGPSNTVTVTVPQDLAFPFNFVGVPGL
jgi:fibronectin type 3 domain-containing protein